MIGGPPEVIEKFEKRFGGAEALQQTFANYVDQMRVGTGLEDVKWAQDYLQKWSRLGLASASWSRRGRGRRRAPAGAAR